MRAEASIWNYSSYPMSYEMIWFILTTEDTAEVLVLGQWTQGIVSCRMKWGILSKRLSADQCNSLLVWLFDMFWDKLRHRLNWSWQRISKNREKNFGHYSPPCAPRGVPHISAQEPNLKNRCGQYVFKSKICKTGAALCKGMKSVVLNDWTT